MTTLTRRNYRRTLPGRDPSDIGTASSTAARRAMDRLRPGEHPDWCARTHACGLGEHRATPVTLTAAGRAAVVLTRVLAAGGRQHAEIRIRIGLAAGDGAARAHLGDIVLACEALLRRVSLRR